MSIVVKGMEMPKNCTLCDSIGLNVAIGCPVMTGINGRATDCPLAELPEKHGRLIDESIVLEMIRKSMGIADLSFLYNAEKSVVNEIYHAPTVIEAEGQDAT